MLKYGREKNDYNSITIFNEGITLQSESLNLDLVNIQVTGCWFKTLEHVAMPPPFVSLSLFLGPNIFYFPCFGTTMHHLKVFTR